jgi:hypothetical protein
MLKQLLLLPVFINNAINVNGNTLTLDLNYGTANIEYSQNFNNDTNMYDYFYKSTNNTPRNDHIDIHTNNYAQNSYYDGDVNLQNFYIAQVTPYYDINDTDIDLTLRIRMDFQDIENQTITYSAIFTYDVTALDYINRTDWATLNKCDDYFYNLTNNELREFEWIYNSVTTNYNRNSLPFVEIPIENLGIDHNETAYVIVYAYSYTPLLNLPINYDRSHRFMSVENLALTATLLNYGRTTEIVDIPGLMFTVLTMPFAFISQAFNLTLFPGTPYQINISNIFLALIGVALLLWVLKVILGKAELGGFLQDTRNDAATARTRKAEAKLQKQKLNEAKYKEAKNKIEGKD